MQPVAALHRGDDVDHHARQCVNGAADAIFRDVRSANMEPQALGAIYGRVLSAWHTADTKRRNSAGGGGEAIAALRRAVKRVGTSIAERAAEIPATASAARVLGVWKQRVLGAVRNSAGAAFAASHAVVWGSRGADAVLRLCPVDGPPASQSVAGQLRPDVDLGVGAAVGK